MLKSVHIGERYSPIRVQFSRPEGFNPIGWWITEFEEQAVIMCWSDVLKLTVAKKSLRGTSNLFIMSVRQLGTWDALKAADLNEFKTVVNSKQKQEQLSKNKRSSLPDERSGNPRRYL